ncbi:FxsA family protein [Paracoccaceae bacterium]|nr:FxsA family protein [Paracoccaceae bacterium]
MWLFVLFIAVPIIEIALFIQIGGFLGFWMTMLIVILTAIIGTRLVKSQGLNAIKDVQNSFINGGNTANSLINGALILVAGVLLLTPGFFTDFIGLTFLIPSTRSRWIKYGTKYFKTRVHFNAGSYQESQAESTSSQQDIIDADYTDLDK